MQPLTVVGRYGYRLLVFLSVQRTNVHAAAVTCPSVLSVKIILHVAMPELCTCIILHTTALIPN